MLLKLKPVLPPLLTVLKIQDADEMAKQKAALKRWLVRHQPDAVLTVDIEIPAMIRELGYRIPQDIAVAGTSVLDIPVDAGIDQHSEAIGRIAVEMLVKQINVRERGEPRDPSRILIESRWKDGNSLPLKQ
jgi:LacI family transcriptional regulator